MAQAQAVGIPLYQRRASWETYEREFKKAVALLKKSGRIQGGVFGDIALDGHRAWVERICTEAGIVPLIPLWGVERKALLRTFIEAGFEAIIVALRRDIVDDCWLGARIDGGLIEKMERSGIDVCGENGEYHSLVVDGPIFKKRIAINESQVARRGTMAFLRVLSFAVEGKA
jgi:uncharacterized protein (TIGR00290 family)